MKILQKRTFGRGQPGVGGRTGAGTGATVGGVGATGGNGRMIWSVVDRVWMGFPNPPPSG